MDLSTTTAFFRKDDGAETEHKLSIVEASWLLAMVNAFPEPISFRKAMDTYPILKGSNSCETTERICKKIPGVLIKPHQNRGSRLIT